MKQSLCIYSHEFYPKRGGIGTYCHEFAHAATLAEYQVEVVVPHYAALPPSEDLPYALVRYKNRGTLNPRSIWRTRRVLQDSLESAPKSIRLLAEPGPILALGTLSERIKTGSLALTLHGSEVARWAENPVARRIARNAFRRSTSIITVSGPINELFKSNFPEFSEKVYTVHSAAPYFFSNAGMQHKRSYEADQERPIRLLSVGRIHPRKNYGDLLIALSKLDRKRARKVEMTIAGSLAKPRYLKELQAQAHELGVTVNWVLNPNEDELVDCYRDADIFALVSRQKKKSIEGYGLVFLEAGCFGLPCIAYADGGVVDAIEDGETGHLVAPGDTDSLGASIAKLADSFELRREIGEANRRRAQSRTWGNVVEETFKTLD